MSTMDAAALAPGSKLTSEQTFDLLVAAQEQLREREAELSSFQQAQDQTKRDVINAELTQDDLFTKRARPMVVYAGLLFIFLNYVLVPAISSLSGNPLKKGLELPTDFWWAWASIVTTWSIGRSFEKTGASNRITRMITGSPQGPLPPSRAPGANDGAVG